MASGRGGALAFNLSLPSFSFFSFLSASSNDKDEREANEYWPPLRKPMKLKASKVQKRSVFCKGKEGRKEVAT
jgi:hypothetical protein